MDPLLPQDPKDVGRYRILGRLGSGGMGQVYLGRSPGGRAVAVKLIRREFADQGDFRKRFAREVEAVRRVGGHYTAQVIDADPDAHPLPWMATTYIPGPSLQDTVQRFRCLATDVVESLAAGLAEGLETIHACRLVHRDLKPENVILAIDGPRIIDFSIARALDGSVMTAHGAVLGTYAFMAPEQVNGQVAGPPADVFSLGSVLYFAVTGRYPFGTGPEAAERIRRGPPDLSSLPERLGGVIGRCFAPDPADRPTAGQILAGLTTRPAESGLPPQVVDVINSRLAEAAAALNVTLTTGPRRLIEPSTPSKQRGHGMPVPSWKPPPAPGKISRRALLGAGLGTVAVTTTAGVFAGDRIGHSTTPRPRSSPPPPADRNVLTGHSGAVNSLAFAPDGRTVASAGADGTVRLWDLAGRRATAVLRGHSGAVRSVAFSPNRSTLASGGADTTVRVWDLGTDRTTRVLTGQGGAVDSLDFAPDGGILAGGGADHSARLWSMATSGVIATLADRPAAVTSVRFGTDGTVLITAYADGTIGFWNTTTHKKGGLLTTPGATSITSLAVARTGLLAYGEVPGSVALWTGQHSLDPPLHTSGPVNAVDFHPDGKRLAVGTSAGVILMWDTSRRKAATPLGGHNGAVTSVAVSPDGRLVASGGADRTVRLWSIT